jgi:hypothetical protein
MHRHRDLLSLLWQRIAGKPCSMTVAAKAESVSKPGAARQDGYVNNGGPSLAMP